MPQLCAVWRSINAVPIHYEPLDPDTVYQQLSPIALEMLAEDLPQLLQSLLVGVEHAINRVPLDELTLFHYGNGGGSQLGGGATGGGDLSTTQTHQKLILSPLGSPKCGLKRRELINKNKLSNNKYALKRMLSSKSSTTENDRTDFSSDSSSDAAAMAAAVAAAAAEPVCTLPLFCLGRSFPHIDSDEESCDDTIKSETGEF